jgi:short-subunit dehydrogenase
VGYSEALALYARPRGISVSVLCPTCVDTNLHETGRVIGLTPEELAADTAAAQAAVGGEVMSPAAIGELVVEGIEQERFFILADPSHQGIVLRRAQDWNAFLEGRLGAAGIT